MHPGRHVLFLAAAGLIAGALLPWVKITSLFGELSVAGYEGDGLLTGGIGLLLLLTALLTAGRAGRRYSPAAAALGALALAVALWDLFRVQDAIAQNQVEGLMRAAVGAGLYLTLAAAALALVGGLQRLPEEPTASPPESSAPASSEPSS